VDAEGWDERYRASESVWGAAPNVFVAAECADLPPGRAIDVACGEGRNALWLAGRGWHVTAVDFAGVGLAKGRAAEEQLSPPHPVEWVLADATTYLYPETDLALICYLQLPATERRAAVRAAAQALAPGGVLLVVGHDSANLTGGTGGPQDPDVLYTAAELADDLAGLDIVVDRAEAVLRTVAGAERPAIDALLRAHRP
jgi:SAM-dependent methyltransferase